MGSLMGSKSAKKCKKIIPRSTLKNIPGKLLHKSSLVTRSNVQNDGFVYTKPSFSHFHPCPPKASKYSPWPHLWDSLAPKVAKMSSKDLSPKFEKKQNINVDALRLSNGPQNDIQENLFFLCFRVSVASWCHCRLRRPPVAKMRPESQKNVPRTMKQQQQKRTEI